MPRSFTDESRLWVIFDTCTRPEYYMDVHRILAAPMEWIVRYDYKAKYLTNDVVEALRESNAPLPRDILLVYAQTSVHVRGADPPKQTPPFAEMIWLPTRVGRMMNIVEEGEKFFFDFQVTDYPSPGPNIQAICRALYDVTATPFSKWIAFAGKTKGLDLVGGQQPTDVNWHRIVEELDRPPSQFAGDLFWRVHSVKRSGKAGRLEPSTMSERDGDSIRQVRSHFSTLDASAYVAEITTLRSPAGRAGGAPQQFLIVAKADNQDLLRVVGPGEIQPRQYTSDHLEFETGTLVFPKGRRVDLTLSTSPKDGVWPQGPELNLRFRVAKSWFVLIGALVSLAIGSTLVAKEGRAVFVGQGGWEDGVFLVGGILLVALSATLWTGKLTTK